MLKNFLILLMMIVTTLSYGQREIKDQSLILNNGTDRNVTIEFNLGLGANNPKYRFNASSDVWEFTHDGTTWQTMVGLDYTNTQLALKAPLASPSFTGTPTAPTAAASDNSTKLATTAYTDGAVATSAAADDARLDPLEASSADHETRLDTIEADTTLSTHISATAAHGATGAVVGTTNAQTLSSKTISADSNTITDIDVGELKSGVLDADLGGVSASHDTLPSAKAVKDYVDTSVSAGGSALAAHLSDTIDAHDASAISNVASGNLIATDVQAALNEHQGDLDSHTASIATNASAIAALDSTYATDAQLTAHEADTTSIHGIANTADLVTLTGTQTLTNKTISGPSIQSPTRADVKKDTLANLTTYAATATNGQIVFATDEKIMYQVVDNALVPVGSGSGEASNLLSNGGFENTNPIEDWTLSPASPTLDITTPFEGEQTLCFSPAGGPLEISQDFSTNAAAFADGNTEGVASVHYKNSISQSVKKIYMCPRKAAAITTECVLLNADNEWSYAEKFFSFGGTSNGISIHSESYGNVASGTICLDKLKVAVQEEPLIGTYQEGDTEIFATGPTSYGATNTAIPYFPNVTSKGDAISVISNSTLGTSFTATRDTFCSITGYLSSSASATNFNAGVTLNSTMLTTTISSVSDGSTKVAARDTINTAATLTKLVPFSWTGPLKYQDVLRVHSDTQALAGGQVTVSCAGSLKAVSVNKNQKVNIPTSEVRFEGYASRGATDTTAIRFSAMTKQSGDGFEINPLGADTSYGTHVKMKKSGVLNVSCMGSSSVTGMYFYSILNSSQEIGSDSIQVASTQRANCGGQIKVLAGDIVKVTATPGTVGGANLNLTLQEQEVQVSVSNTLPVFTTTDNIMKASNNAGTSVTADVTDIPFTSTIEDTLGSWNGSQYTVKENGVCSITGRVSFTGTLQRAVSLYVNGSLYKTIGSATTNTAHDFAIIDSFTKGQILSIRVASNGGTLFTTSATTYHYLNIVCQRDMGAQVDVTPFVEVPVLEKHYARFTKGTTGSATAYATIGSITMSEDTVGGLFSYNTTTGVFTSLKNTDVVASVSGVTGSAASCFVYVNAKGTRLYGSATSSTSGFETGRTRNFHLASGEQFYFETYDNKCTGVVIEVTATATPDTIVTPVESFSTDSAALVWKHSGEYTLATLPNSPIGSLITYSFTASTTHTKAQCTTGNPPSQSVSDMAANGIRVYGRIYTGAGTCATPSYVAINVGKGHKGFSLNGYGTTGKVNLLNLDASLASSNGTMFGLAVKSYNAATGVLILDGGTLPGSSVTTHLFWAEDNSSVTSAYVTFEASKTPTLSGISYAAPRVAFLSDVKTSGTAGGSSLAATYQTRTLNTEDDQSDFLTLSGSQFTLPAGEYIIEGSAPAYAAGLHKARIRNVTDSTTVLMGQSAYSTSTTPFSMTHSNVYGRFSISASKTFELQHYTNAALATTGLGLAASTGESEVYSQLKITKVR